jgi:hypothetical protein
MKCRLVKLEKLSGNQATVYTVVMDGEQLAVFDVFLEENKDSFKDEIKSILGRLHTIGHKTGARIDYFKEREGRYGDGMCALYDDPDKKLRLYCLKFGSQIIVIGGGGPKTVEKWQQDEKLEEEANRMINLAKQLNKRLESKDIKYTDDYLEFDGDLEFDI